MAEVAYLGPDGSFANLVARKRFNRSTGVSMPTIPEVVEFVRQKKGRRGVVPIENSSAGIIPDTVDCLVSADFNLTIQEEISVHVRLAFAGRKNRSIEKIYSHFAPLQHCGLWIAENYPQAQVCKVTSTSEAVRIAAQEEGAAALCTLDAAQSSGLDVLVFPVLEQVANVTQFFVIGHGSTSRQPQETSLVAALHNTSGSLCHFLQPFAKHQVNLKRIISRNVVGHPNTYVFFVGLEGALESLPMKRALKEVQKIAKEIRLLGSYPTAKPYLS